MTEQRPQPTEKQRLSLAAMVTRARDKHGVESLPAWSDHHPWWITKFRDEIRPGRGHDMDATVTTGDHFVQIVLDPYGSGTLSVAELDWIHSDADDECACDECERERR
jgi:hypothetical protein